GSAPDPRSRTTTRDLDVLPSDAREGPVRGVDDGHAGERVGMAQQRLVLPTRSTDEVDELGAEARELVVAVTERLHRAALAVEPRRRPPAELDGAVAAVHPRIVVEPLVDCPREIDRARDTGGAAHGERGRVLHQLALQAHALHGEQLDDGPEEVAGDVDGVRAVVDDDAAARPRRVD